jgi:hypothetical protein
MLDISNSLSTLDKVESGLLTNVIVNALANFVLGVFIPLCILMNRFKGDVPCIPGDGAVEKTLIDAFNKYLGLAFHVVKLVPAVLALMAMSGFTGTMSDAANGDCAASDDKLTSRTFTDLDSELQTSSSSLTTQVATDVVMIIVEAIMTAMAWMSAQVRRNSAQPFLVTFLATWRRTLLVCFPVVMVASRRST